MLTGTPQSLSVTARYAAAAVISVLAIGVRNQLAPLVGDSGQFLLSFPAVLASAWIGGAGPGLFAVLLCSLAAAWYILPPYESLAVARAGDRIVLTLFALLSAGLCGLVERLQRLGRTAELDRQALRSRERELSQSVALKTAILDTALDAVVALDAGGLVQEWNTAAERLFGYLRQAAVGRPLAELIIPEAWRQAHHDGIAHYLQTGKRTILGRRVELTGMNAAGAEFPVEVRIDQIRTDGTPAFVGFIRDARERQEAEAALNESQDLFHRFMEHSPALAFIRDAAGRIVYANAAYEQFFGTTLAELAGRTLTELVPQETARELRTAYERVLAEEVPRQECFLIPTPDGRVHDCQFYLFPLTNTTGERLLGGLVLDVSDQRRLEEQLRQSQKMEAVGRLAGGIAHDFNNMLAVISGYSELLLLELRASDPTHGPLTEIRKASERAANLTRQLLAFSRQQVLAPQRLDLNEVLGDIAAMLRRLIGEDLELHVQLSPVPAPVVADLGQIEQLLLNLLVNARDAMPHGGRITVEVSRMVLGEAYVQAHLESSPGAYVVLAVTDTGCGMDAATVAQIFEPFFTTKAPGIGTGLGLATVHGIVKQTGGEIRVYSEVGVGTCFKVYFPVAEGAAEPLAPRAEPAAPGAETILLVEDERMLRSLVRTVLEEWGYRVLEAADPDEAAAYVEGHVGQIDLLLTDVVMPKTSGREIATRFLELRPEARVLYMSGYTDDAVVRHGVLRAEAHFLQKPFTPTSLARKVREVLDQP